MFTQRHYTAGNFPSIKDFAKDMSGKHEKKRKERDNDFYNVAEVLCHFLTNEKQTARPELPDPKLLIHFGPISNLNELLDSSMPSCHISELLSNIKTTIPADPIPKGKRISKLSKSNSLVKLLQKDFVQPQEQEHEPLPTPGQCKFFVTETISFRVCIIIIVRVASEVSNFS